MNDKLFLKFEIKSVLSWIKTKAKKGMFILTESSKPEYKQNIHSGAVHIATIQMQTLTFKSNSKVSLLKNLFHLIQI